MIRELLVVLASISLVSLPATISYKYGVAFQQETFGNIMFMFCLEYVLIAIVIAVVILLWVLVLTGCVTIAKEFGFLEEKK